MRLRQLFLIGLSVSLLHAFSPLHFSKEELLSVQKRYGQIAINRIEHFRQHIELFRPLQRQEQLIYVNAYLNRLLGSYDAITRDSEEYWQTPKEFLALGEGDCEDYAILKYYMLLALGFEKERFCLGVVFDRFSISHHMVLLYYEKENGPPLVLDNLSSELLPLKERTDLEPLECFNEAGRYRLNLNSKHFIDKKQLPLFNDLLKRIEEGK